jgi:hypothetical protein
LSPIKVAAEKGADRRSLTGGMHVVLGLQSKAACTRRLLEERIETSFVARRIQIICL